MLSPLDVGVFGFYMLLLVGVGVYFTRQQKGLKSYLLADQNIHWIIVAVSVSSVWLMVIISRFISSFARTSFGRMSSLSARSFTVMPSASVIVREIGGGAAGACGEDCRGGPSRLCPDAGRCPA